MEYTEYCPKCNQQVRVEEEGNVYVIKNNKGDVIKYCPNCRRELKIIDGVMSIVKKEE